MEREERIKQLNALAGHLLSKYNLSHHSCNHICFYVKPQDVIDIVNNYYELLESSNLYASPATIGLSSLNADDFKVSTGVTWFNVKSKNSESKNRFSFSEKMEEADEIEVDISCEVILSIQFQYKDIKSSSQYSFRFD